jgi:predicted metal-binding protein
MPRVGIIRCQQTEDICPGTTDFKIAREGKLAFEGMVEVEVVGFVSCGGCPGKRAVNRAKMLKERGAEAIAFASCIGKGRPNDFPCPHFKMMKKAVTKAVGPEVRIIDWTH